MRRSAMLPLVSCVYIVTSLSTVAIAQTPRHESFTQYQTTGSIHKSRIEHQPATPLRQMLRRKANSGLVGILRGASGANSLDSSELSQQFTALEQDDLLRVFQVEGRGSLQDVTDLAFARGIDAGIIQSDTLAFLRREPLFPGMHTFLQYVAKLSDKEVHVLAASDIGSLQDLAGKRVNFGPRDGETFMTGARVFESVKTNVDPTNLSHDLALEKLRRGEIAAMVYVAAKPANLFQFMTPADNLHFLPVPASMDTDAGYRPARLEDADYPQSIEGGKAVETLAVGSILIVYNWPRGTDRFRKVSRFVKALLDQLDSMRTPAHHPKWRDLDISSPVPGWTRFAPAEEWIKAHPKYQQANVRRQATALPNSAQSPSGGLREQLTEAEAKDLFRDFLRYAQQEPVTRTASGSSGTQLFTEFLQYAKRESVRVGESVKADRQPFPDQVNANLLNLGTGK